MKTRRLDIAGRCSRNMRINSTTRFSPIFFSLLILYASLFPTSFLFPVVLCLFPYMNDRDSRFLISVKPVIAWFCVSLRWNNNEIRFSSSLSFRTWLCNYYNYSLTPTHSRYQPIHYNVKRYPTYYVSVIILWQSILDHLLRDLRSLSWIEIFFKRKNTLHFSLCEILSLIFRVFYRVFITTRDAFVYIVNTNLIIKSFTTSHWSHVFPTMYKSRVKSACISSNAIWIGKINLR